MARAQLTLPETHPEVQGLREQVAALEQQNAFLEQCYLDWTSDQGDLMNRVRNLEDRFIARFPAEEKKR